MLGRELFEIPPEGFTEARNALSAELKAGGDAEGAAAVRSLRRPTVTAYAVNRLARSDPRGIEELLDAGRTLAAAQQKVLSGRTGAAGDLRDATDARREVIRRLTDGALGLMEAEGRKPDPLRDGVAATLEAASVDEALGERLREGTLEREATPTAGLGGIEGFSVLDGGRQQEGAASPAKRSGPEMVKTAEKTAREAAKAADAAERAAAKAQEQAAKLRASADAAEAAARLARDDARRLGDEARTARRRADKAARGAEAARDRA